MYCFESSFASQACKSHQFTCDNHKTGCRCTHLECEKTCTTDAGKHEATPTQARWDGIIEHPHQDSKVPACESGVSRA